MVGLVLLGRIAFAAHLLLVPHDVCQHGRLMHLSDHRSVAAEVQSSERSLAVHDASPADDSHEHCDVVVLHEAPPSAVAPALPEGLVAWQLVLPASSPGAEVSSVSLLSLAPKQSPPQS